MKDTLLTLAGALALVSVCIYQDHDQVFQAGRPDLLCSYISVPLLQLLVYLKYKWQQLHHSWRGQWYLVVHPPAEPQPVRGTRTTVQAAAAEQLCIQLPQPAGEKPGHKPFVFPRPVLRHPMLNLLTCMLLSSQILFAWQAVMQSGCY